ncbi:peroxiredoxin-5, mitochondrial [Patella vulgata]|uniref:peroxiredoxin-5, mitochondrial n=1 Tax=Patella vulgata TaxID=6465 RepID=UPI00217F74C1|nr:peroxiredoxin-5, mitochondrial [Patella vulgata]
MATAQLTRRITTSLLNNSLHRPAACCQIKRYLKIGDTLPDIKLYEDNPDNGISVRDIYKGKKGVLFSVVGAFTPGCTHAHIPEYLESADKFKEEGYDLIGCVSVNDPFVMAAWGQDLKAEGKIRMLADTKGEFTKAMGMELDCSKLLGNIRSRRYSLVIEDSKVHTINEDPQHSGLVCLLCIRNLKTKAQVMS